MTDRYRGPGYDGNRRGSFPNRVWVGERLAPVRPLPPVRSQTNMDPRKLSYNGNPGTMDSAKRKASRSPEGGQPRKQMAADGQRGCETTTANNIESRRSSVSNGTSHHVDLNGMSPLSRRGSIPTGFKNLNGSVNVASPASKGSPRDDATSGRSTPQQRTTSTIKPPTGPRAQEALVSDANGTGRPNPLFELLTNFSSQLATHAALQISRQQAEARYDRAQLEYNELKPNFKAFPAIRERKSADREAAQKTLKSKEEEVKKHVTSQQQLVGTLAALIDQSAAKAMEASKADYVSRADFDKLQTNYDELKKEVNGTNGLVKSTRGEVAQVKEIANAAKRVADKASSEAGQVHNILRDLLPLKEDVGTLLKWKSGASTTLDQVSDMVHNQGPLKKNVDNLLEWKGGASARLNDLNKLQDRLQDVTNQSNETTTALKDFQTYDVSKLATRAQFVELEAKQETLTQNVAGVQKKNSELSKDFGQFKAKGAQANLNQQAPVKAPATEALKEKIEKVSTEHAEFRDKIEKRLNANDQLHKRHENTSPEDDDLKDKVDALFNKGGSLISTVDTLQEQMTHVHQEIDFIKDNVIEEGKGPIVKRVKNLDKVVNNVSVKIDADGKIPLHQRVSQLEQGRAGLQKDVQTTKTSPQPMLTSSGSIDLGSITNRMTTVEHRMGDLETDQATKDELLDEEFESVRSLLQGELDGIRRGRDSEVAAFNETFQQMGTRFQDLVSSLGTKASTEAMGSVKSEVSSLSEEFKKLHAQHQKAKSTSQTPTPGQPGLPPHVPTSFSAGSPQLPNGVGGSPQVNGVHQPPQQGSAFANSGAQAPQNQTMEMQQEMGKMVQEMGRLQMQLNQVVGVTHHLKQRQDNLQTDEVVRQMVDQMSQMYPDAKNLARTHDELKKHCNNLNARVDTVQHEKEAAVSQLNRLVGESSTKAENAQETAQSVATGLQNSLKLITAADVLAKRVDKELGILKSSFDKKIPDLESSAEKHESVLKKGEQEIKKTYEKMEEMQAAIDTMLKQMGEGMGKIQALEKFQ